MRCYRSLMKNSYRSLQESPSRVRWKRPQTSSISTSMTKVRFGVNTLTNIPVCSCFRHEQDLNPGGSRMEIYETISHVSTNQVWLHINSASSRVYFRPIAPSSPALLGWCGPTCQKLPVPRNPFHPSVSPSYPLLLSLFLLHDIHLLLLPYSPYTWYARYI